MSVKKTIVCIIGTRPEAIKMASVIKAINQSNWAQCKVVLTGQHRELITPMLTWFDIRADHDLDLMRVAQNPGDLIGRMLPKLENLLQKLSADMVLAQGDTATTFASVVAAFHTRIPFGHIEAGLRTHDLNHPFPEEGYRQMISRLAKWHFAPTDRDKSALIAEGIAESSIVVTGNTGLDALLDTATRLPVGSTNTAERIILLTAHRRESFGSPLRGVFAALREVIDDFPDIRLRYPVHPNPNVQSAAQDLLSGHPRIELTAPLSYLDFVKAMRDSTLILTDSGGVQEEAPALGKPVLILRETTERIEAVEQGHAVLVGMNPDRIKRVLADLLDDSAALANLSQVGFPFGDGRSNLRILNNIKSHM